MAGGEPCSDSCGAALQPCGGFDEGAEGAAAVDFGAAAGFAAAATGFGAAAVLPAPAGAAAFSAGAFRALR
jgi:hypothetical protein